MDRYRRQPFDPRNPQPDKDARALLALARWMIRFSPCVAVESTDALFLDITGSQRLFGGFDRLLELVHNALFKLHLHHALAIAPTPGAAWAITFLPNALVLLDLDQIAPALRPLPLATLRLSPPLVQAFAALGIDTIGQLIDLPRQTLPARFGDAPLDRLDQALGRLPEPLHPVTPHQSIEARFDFDSPVHNGDVIWNTLASLVDQLLPPLAHRGMGIRSLAVDFFLPSAPAISKNIALSHPTANPAVLLNLLRCALDAIQLDPNSKIQFDLTALRLRLLTAQPLVHHQIPLLDHDTQAAIPEVDRLIQRLLLRLGEDSVLRPALVESHFPERSFQYLSPAQWPLNISVPLLSCSPAPLLCSSSAPLHLFPHPIEIGCIAANGDEPEARPISFTFNRAVHHITHAVGPQRIAAPWWEGRHHTRDYFDVQDTTGRHWWLFQTVEARRWFLHGTFDA